MPGNLVNRGASKKHGKKAVQTVKLTLKGRQEMERNAIAFPQVPKVRRGCTYRTSGSQFSFTVMLALHDRREQYNYGEK
eukprot:1143719-Pelagomonas_calceolata.AAC.4